MREDEAAETQQHVAEVQLVLKIEQSLGNCPKYLNKKHVELAESNLEQLAAFSSLEIPIVSQKYKSRSPRATNLTSRNLICLSDRLNDLCDGLCLDCLKGRDRCGWSARHPPDPWEKYEADRKRVFEQRKRYPSSSRSTRSSRAGSPGRDLWDENMFHVVDDGMWDLA
jgi:hypothetical protein